MPAALDPGMPDEDHCLRPLQTRCRQGNIKPDLPKEEVRNVPRLQKAGVIREIYGRADAPGGVIVFEIQFTAGFAERPRFNNPGNS